MKIRILHIFPTNFKYRFGGQIIWWKNTLEHWNSPEICHKVLDFEKNRIADAKEILKFSYSGYQNEKTRWERAKWILLLFKYLNQYRKQYDILHVHVLWWGGLLIGPWAKWKNIPALYESVLLDSDTPGGIHNEKFGGLKIRCLKNFKAILTISQYLEEDYRKFGFSKKQTFTLMNCVDMELFSPSNSAEKKKLLRHKLKLPQNATILVFVGSVKERKGVDVLIRAFIGACSERSDLYMLIVGPKNKNENPSIDEDFVNDLYLLLNKNNISERVSFTGMIQDRQKLAEMYRASDIFVFPSNKEGLGNVVLEAMASELPVVVTQLPVLENIIRHGENGLFVPIGDVDAVKDSILTLSNDPSLSKKLGLAAKNYVREEHSFIIWQSQLVKLYRGLIPH